MWPDQTLLDALNDTVDSPSLHYCSHLTLIRATGADTFAYLQGQLTCDLTALKTGGHRPAMHLSLKGRGLFSTRLFAVGDDIYLIVPKALVDTTITALTKYRLRAKVEFIHLDNAVITGISSDLEALNWPDTSWPEAGMVTVTGDPGNAPPWALLRYPFTEHALLICTQADAEKYWHDLGSNRQLGSSVSWISEEIKAGEGWVLPGGEDHFLPQTLNFDVTGGVSFNKGCYTGQEVVARMHFKGKLKQRMQHFTYTTDIELNPGDTLRNAEGKSLGEVVMAAQGRPHRALALLPQQLDEPLYFDNQDLDASLAPLPYSLPWK